MWPDWTGETVAIIASGPSLKKADVQLLRGNCKVIAIKKNVEFAPWADVVYGCDGPWWRSVQFLPNFNGIKISYEPTVCNSETKVKKIDIVKEKDTFLFDKIGVVGSGGNSGFQAINLAAQFGAKRILLLGFDMNANDGEHWYGRNNWEMANNPTPHNFQRWQRAFTASAKILRARGIEVINCSRRTSLNCFPVRSIDDAMKEICDVAV